MGRPGGRIDDAVFFVGVLALILVVALFLYTADSRLHRDINTLWRAINDS